jgi:hypothetical protein
MGKKKRESKEQYLLDVAWFSGGGAAVDDNWRGR